MGEKKIWRKIHGCHRCFCSSLLTSVFLNTVKNPKLGELTWWVMLNPDETVSPLDPENSALMGDWQERLVRSINCILMLKKKKKFNQKFINIRRKKLSRVLSSSYMYTYVIRRRCHIRSLQPSWRVRHLGTVKGKKKIYCWIRNCRVASMSKIK